MSLIQRIVSWCRAWWGGGLDGGRRGTEGQRWNQAWRLQSAIAAHRQGYIDQLREELKLLELPANDPQRSIVQQILSTPSTLSLAEIFRLEAAIISYLPVAVLRRRAWVIRSVFAENAGERRLALYAASNPPDPASATEEELRADLVQLLGALERVSLTSELEDHLRRRLLRRVRTTALIALAVLTVMLVQSAWHKDSRWVPTIAIVLLAGVVGACFSSQQRLQSAAPEGDVQTRLQILARLTESFYFAPVGGAIGAVVLFCLFSAKMVQGELFPSIEVVLTDSAAQANPHSFFAFLISAGPKDGVHTAKLLVWSFLAGFSERLVLTALDQVGGKLTVRPSDPNR